ncbi:hypothetical protein Pr1d_12850 [Bythopirellula goksoeyrii]|uniref:Uncharacterized protein n=2 Tax=Bythopirellula goksoeyrii TaxID=1400387 RepID=A0A5B9QIT3_9BACT|nr:hypothetical protein Pr1d_12850 [Bythopirellula goksoeyrii]
MVAPRKIRRVFCTVVRVPNADESCMVSENRIQHRPSDRLPWSDPTIARLVANLQDEVRGERRSAKIERRTANWQTEDSAIAEMEPPTPELDTDFDWYDQPRWNWPDQS